MIHRPIRGKRVPMYDGEGTARLTELSLCRLTATVWRLVVLEEHVVEHREDDVLRFGQAVTRASN